MSERYTEICLHLFGKPEWEIDLEKAQPNDISSLGEELRDRLKEISNILEKLEKNGWERSAALYDIMLFKDITKKEAEKELKTLGLDIKLLNIEEFEPEE